MIILTRSEFHVVVKKKDKNHVNNSLGIRLIALSGLSTLIVRIADKFMFSTFRQYSRALS